jgi:hypothetical protein
MAAEPRGDVDLLVPDIDADAEARPPGRSVTCALDLGRA